MDRYKVVLVDDEQTIIEGFKKLIDWEKSGFEIAGEANDGAMAEKLMLDLRPDLAIVDINIPILSGLELIREVSKKLPETVFLIISGYDEFKYMREALHLRVTDYILKPVDFKEFSKLLLQIRMNLLEKNRIRIRPGGQEAAGDKTGEDMIQQMVLYINGHLAEDITLKRLADEFHMNSSYVSQFFKNNTGMNYREYLTFLRINRAKELLTATKISICEISSQVGFRDYRVFTKVFKKREGVLPSQYRKNVKSV